MAGELCILNVGVGDTKLTFDKRNPAETIRAGRIVRDMLRRGYALLVQSGTDSDGKAIYSRAIDFDENAGEYIIADFDSVIAAENDGNENDEPSAEKETASRAPRGSKARRRVPANATKAVAVARTAGG